MYTDCSTVISSVFVILLPMCIAIKVSRILSWQAQPLPNGRGHK